MARGDRLVEKAREFIGQDYWSMHNGALDGRGFGCAMMVAACYNAVFTDGAYCTNTGDIGAGGALVRDWKGRGCYGSTYNFWGEVTDRRHHQYGMGEWRITDRPVPGDVVCYIADGADERRSTACEHVALYVGDGRCIGALGVGRQSFRLGSKGVNETSVSAQCFGTHPRYIHSTLLDEEDEMTDADFKRIRQIVGEEIDAKLHRIAQETWSYNWGLDSKTESDRAKGTVYDRLTQVRDRVLAKLGK